MWELPPTLAPAAYSHGSVAKQCPRSCEAPRIKTVLECYISALLGGTNPHYCHLWLKGVGPIVDKHSSIHML